MSNAEMEKEQALQNAADHPPAVALLEPDELRMPQPVGLVEPTTKTPVVVPADLEHLIKDADAASAVLAKFDDKRVNFRSEKIMVALNEKRKQVIVSLARHHSTILREMNVTDSSVQVERNMMLKAINMTIKEVNDTFTMWLTTSNKIQQVLERNYTSVDSILAMQKERSEDSKKNLQKLQIDALREESKLKEIEENEKKMVQVAKAKKEAAEHADGSLGHQIRAPDALGAQVDAVLENVGDKANVLRERLEEPAFLKAQRESGANLLTVVKLGEHEIRDPGSTLKKGAEDEEEDGGPIDGAMFHLVDAENNQYALSKPKDSTIMPADLNLLQDIVIILASCFCAGFLCNALSMPPLIGYVCAGTVCGPAGYNLIMSLVQVSTLGEFGVFLVLFTLGLEFSISKLKEVWRVAVLAGSAMMLAAIVAGLAVGALLERSFSESLFTSVLVALSSTTVVVNGMSSSDQDSTFGRGLVGILLMQDVYLGAIVATTSLVGEMGEVSFVDGIMLVLQLLASLLLVVIFATLASKYVLPRLILEINGREGSVKMLGLLAICFTVMSLTDILGVSNELGCFVAGVMISASQPSSRDRPMHGLIATIEPVRDCFLAIFLASVGMHIYPTFLISNGKLIIILTLSVILMKYASAMMVWLLVWRSEDVATGHALSAGLAQISEFGFVLASRGVRYKFITMPVYFLLLSVSAMTLLIWPFVFGVAKRTMRYFSRPKTKSIRSPAPKTAAFERDRERGLESPNSNNVRHGRVGY